MAALLTPGRPILPPTLGPVVAALHDDWRWAQACCLPGLGDPDPEVIRTATAGLGLIARIRGDLDLDRVTPALDRFLDGPKTPGLAQDVLDDIQMFVRVH
jgi:hypothetical protein